MTRYTKRQDHEWFRVPVAMFSRLACCDCGLVHRIYARVTKSGRVYLAAARDVEETKRHRAQRKRKP